MAIGGFYLDGLSLDAYAKVNLVLDVTGRRSDGYHLVRMIMQTIGICDTLIFRKGDKPGIRLTMNAGDLPAGPDNLIIKGISAALESAHRADDISMDIELVKRIPVAAGMAGGSTDAAAAMTAVNRLENLELTDEQLRAAAVKVGADVPYCLMGGTVLAEGIGEILTPIDDIGDICIAVAKPAESVSTKQVYKKLDSISDIRHPDVDGAVSVLNSRDDISTDELVRRLAVSMGNVLEYVTVPDHKDIAEIKKVMEECGAVKAMMSGSGPSVFGIYENESEAEKACGQIRSRGLTDEVFVTHTIGRGEGETIYA